jgi:hypothetical protein
VLSFRVIFKKHFKIENSHFFFQKSLDKDLTYLINMFPTVDPGFLFQKVLELDGDRNDLENWVFRIIDKKEIDQLPKISAAKTISEVKYIPPDSSDFKAHTKSKKIH